MTSFTFFSIILDASVIFFEQYLFRLDARGTYYLKWFLILSFCVLPFIFIGLLYISVILLQIYRQDHQIIDHLAQDIQNHEWRLACRRMTAAVWVHTARLWNGFNLVVHPESRKLLLRPEMN